MDYAMLARQRAAELGIDPDLAVRMMMTESSGNPSAVSPKGAQGLFQLMPGTAQDLGVDPTDPVQNIDGGLRYYKQMLDQFQDPRLALAAYNAGPGNVQKYGGIPPFQETQNYVQKILPQTEAKQVAQANTGTANAAPTQEDQGFNPSIDEILSALDKAKAANNEKAVAEIQAFAAPKFQEALGLAKEAGNKQAVEEIQSIGSQYGILGTASKATPEVAPKDTPKKNTSFLGDVVLGAADALTFGFADEAAAKVASMTKGTKYEDELEKVRSAFDQAGPGKYVGAGATFLIPGIGAVRAAQGATRLARAGAGAATGATQGALYGAGSAEGDIGDRLEGAAIGAGTGAVLGGGVGALVPSTIRQDANKIIKDAGSTRAAAMDAEIIKDLNKIAGNVTQRDAPVMVAQLNALENRYIGDVNTALKNIGKPTLEKLGLKADDISTALRDRRIITPDELNNLRGTKAGTALADAIEKAQRARSLTAPIPASTNPIARAGRAILDVAPIPQPLRYAGQRILGSRTSREEAASKLISKTQDKAAADVLSRTGPSAATQSLSRLQQQAQKATAAAQAKQKLMAAQRAAKQAQQQAATVATVGDTASVRRSLGLRGTPLSNAYQTTLERAGVTNEQAIPVLRTLSKIPNNEIGTAAGQLLKSQPVTNDKAFYSIQGILNSVVNKGQPLAAQSASSGIRNPISYAEAVRTAGEAADIARQAAPNKALSQFATKIAGTKDPSTKAKLVSQRLAKATDQAEVDYLNQFVVPLTQFGAKGK